MNPHDTRVYRRIGAAIRAVRLERELSQMRLASLAKVHHNYVSRIERGHAEVSVAVLLRVIRALGMTPAEFWSELAK